MEVKLIQTQLIELARIENNDGQIEGVKRNPRIISEADMEKLKKSLQDHPDMTALRELVVYPYGDKFVVLGGNMRLRAMRMLGYKDAPCKVIPKDTPTEQLNAFIVIDNGDFGAWDWDALANEWDDLPLGDWGVPSWGHDTVDVGDLGIEPVASAGESLSGFTQMTFLFKKDDVEIVQGYIDTFGKDKLVEQIVELCRTAEAK